MEIWRQRMQCEEKSSYIRCCSVSVSYRGLWYVRGPSGALLCSARCVAVMTPQGASLQIVLTAGFQGRVSLRVFGGFNDSTRVLFCCLTAANTIPQLCITFKLTRTNTVLFDPNEKEFTLSQVWDFNPHHNKQPSSGLFFYQFKHFFLFPPCPFLTFFPLHWDPL